MKTGAARGALLGALLGAASAWGGCSRPEGGALPGKELYGACVHCHGADGLGDEKLGAPSIAGLPSWYVAAQLGKFKAGVRGAHPDDAEGLRMRPMARQMMSDAEVKSVAAWVASMPRVPKPPTLAGGDPGAGAASFATCAACHGPGGQGNESLKAPPIAGQADWYLLRQLQKFKAGVRGADPKDASGATMRPMAMGLTEPAMRNVVAHVSKLAGGPP